MDENTRPVGATSLAALMARGPVRRIGQWPIQSVCRVSLSGADSIWIDFGDPVITGRMDYVALWQMVHPGRIVPPGYQVRPLMTPDDARRANARYVRVDLVGHHSKADGDYVLTGVTHSARDHGY